MSIALPKLTEIKQVVIYINPQKVTHYESSPNRAWQEIFKGLDRLKMTKLIQPIRTREYLLGGEWEQKTVPFRSIKRCYLIEDLFKNRHQYQNSLWYGRAMKTLEERGFFKYKHLLMHDQTSVDSFFENNRLPLLDSMFEHGYQQRPQDDVPYFLVGAQGQLYKSRRGRHRFAAALATGVKAGFPVRIETIHTQWWKSNVLKRSETSILDRYRAALTELEHCYK